MFDEQLSVFYSNILFASGGQNVTLLNWGLQYSMCGQPLLFFAEWGWMHTLLLQKSNTKKPKKEQINHILLCLRLRVATVFKYRTTVILSKSKYPNLYLARPCKLSFGWKFFF